MVSTLANSFPQIPDYEIVEQLYLGSRTAVYRAINTLQKCSVVIKLLRRDYPSFGELVQFRNQYTITKNLPISGIIHPLKLESVGNSYALVMEDWQGIALEKYIQQQPLELTEVLTIAIQLADILHELCQHRVVHKDIKPANILVNPESKQVKLIDFSIASLLPKETQEIQSPNTLEGTLAYLAPEQTGRMNRGIDYRTDFYALGVTLYQLLTGTLPFISSDPLELMHSHIAKIPTFSNTQQRCDPASAKDARECAPRHPIPNILKEIVLKLMAKNAEDRYQSALGLKYDLEQCLIQLKETGKIAEFELGQRDLSDRFLIPEKLYGRGSEVQILLKAFDRVSGHLSSFMSHAPEKHNKEERTSDKQQSEMMLVAGFSGIGKTAVINEVHKPIVRQRGYFIKGKFDQFNRNIPLSAFIQALRDLMGQLLCESESQVEQWKDKILAALGENGQVLIEVIPELELIIGSQPNVPELSGSAAQNRFNLLFQKFIAVFTTVEHPLVIFLDDLQWADSASLQFIKLLMNDSHSLLMLGAYRDNEVSPTHPFILTIEELKQCQITVNTITLNPLAFENINHLVADTLHCSVELAQPFTKLINRKTKGNPFFTTQFLKVLHEEGHINFDYNRRYWQCDLAEIKTLALTDNVVEFMALQLQKLPVATQEILKLAACIGNQFDLKTLAIVSEQSPLDIATPLWTALQQGLIQPNSQIYKFFQGVEQSDVDNTVNPKYRFLHDRVQQAAYSLIPENKKQKTHLKIGRLLLQNSSKIDYLFEILSHLNTSLELMTDAQEKQLLSRLNLEGCQRAKLSTAYEAAAQYAQIAISLLPSDTWFKDYKFTLELYQITAEVAYLQTDFTAAEALAHTILQQAQQPIDRSRVYELLVQIYIAKDEQVKAIETGLEALKILEVSLVEPTNWQENLPQLPSNEILQHKPSMTQPNYLAALQILITIIPPTHHVKPELFPSVVLTMVELCDRAGYSGLAAYTYGIYGLLLCAAVGDLEMAHTSGKISLQLLEKYPSRELRSKVNMLFAVFVCACKEPGQNTLPLLKQGIETGLAVGDIEYVSYSIMAYFTHLFLVGHHLKEIESSKHSYLAILEQFKQEHCIEYSKIWLQLTNELESAQELERASQSKTERLKYFQNTHNHQCLFAFHLTQLISCYLFGNYSQALDHAIKAIESEEAAFGVLLTSAHTFYYSLVLLASINPQLSKFERDQHLKQVIANQIKLKRLADCAPENYLHKYQLVAAEIARIREQPADAISLYEQAIAGAKANGYTQELALAYELAARFYIAWDKEKVAAGYMQDAYYGYVRWGAKAKVLNLEHYYPHLLAPILQQQPVSLSATETASIPEMLTVFKTHATQSASSTSILATLDLTTVLKASQTLSSEIELDKLLATLLQMVLENAGADQGALLIPHEMEWYVEAVATIEQPTQVESILLADYLHLPHSLINTVKRNLEPVVIVNATTHPTLSTDDYIVQQQPKSILCTPILHQGKLVAILYLENQVSVGAFTCERVELLNFLCTQAAISLENARLYQQERDKFQQLQENNRLIAFQSRVSHIAARNDDLPDMLQQFCQTIVDQLGASFARIWILKPTENLLELKASAGLYTHINGGHQYVPVGKFKIGLIAQEQAPHLTNDVLNDPRVGDREWAKREGMVAFAGYPLMLNSELLGVVAMFAQFPLSDVTLTSMKVVATEISLGIQRKLLETSVEQKARVLEQALTDLQQAQLQIVQGEKMASLGNLVAGVAHEINNPLGFLNGSIHNAEEYVQDLLEHLELYQQYHPKTAEPVLENAEEIDLEFLLEDLPQLLESMKGATDRIKNISTSLRNFSRADQEYKVSANLHEGIDSTLLILKYRLKASEYRPEIKVIQDYGHLPDIDCFPGQLNQVFMNIIANAIDMFDEMALQISLDQLKVKPQIITIQTEFIPEQNTAQICISDNGKGIPEVIQNKIFEHLFTTKAVGKGTGLGLAIARQIIVENHGGQLICNSTVGEGTEFIIQIPA